jgi:hypothetical protein
LESCFLACEGVHLESQSSVNCSRKGALRVVGYQEVSVDANEKWQTQVGLL